MPSGDGGWFLDLTATPDELLILLAREASLANALNAVRLRHRPRIGQWIRRLAKKKHLGADQITDAQQEALFWTDSAIQSYDVAQMLTPDACSFRTFLKTVICRRFSNFMRGLKRRERRMVGDVDALANVAMPEPADDASEQLERIDAALAQLPEADRTLWEGLRSGKRKHEMAVELGVSTKTIMRRWKCLGARLAKLLADSQPSDPQEYPATVCRIASNL